MCHLFTASGDIPVVAVFNPVLPVDCDSVPLLFFVAGVLLCYHWLSYSHHCVICFNNQAESSTVSDVVIPLPENIPDPPGMCLAGAVMSIGRSSQTSIAWCHHVPNMLPQITSVALARLLHAHPHTNPTTVCMHLLRVLSSNFY